MEDESTLSNKNGSKVVGGMESVIATVSGYHGSERFKLIKLINYTGASYVGAMTKSTTHLVCWEFEGRKYELAKSFGTKIVSHKWFEDCVEAGKRLPERHYMMKSGQQAGPILWEVPVAVDEKDDILTRKRGNVLCDMSNTSNGTQAVERNPESVWLDSHLLSENLSPMGTNVTYHNRGKSAACRTLKRGCRLSSKKCSIEQSLSGLREIQHGEPSTYSSTFSTRHERNAYSSIENPITAGPTRKSRLVKKECLQRHLGVFYHGFGSRIFPTEATLLINEGVAPVDDVPLQHGLSDSEDNYDRTQEVDSFKKNGFDMSFVQGYFFESITKVDSATSSDQKIYSQTIPYDSSATDIYVLRIGS
ncbi:hypothetical protein IFM89_013841 [Coptis chinensis]|uniref:BRCT domain-containing protein n=1 Tax=Coptis chinensis TaxID=261450 RepID=A0A835M9Y2_9MAGN|nr:hypothetical protein IFM89_013841 [Coptis chinensis]